MLQINWAVQMEGKKKKKEKGQSKDQNLLMDTQRK